MERHGTCEVCGTPVHEYPYGWDHTWGPGAYATVGTHDPVPVRITGGDDEEETGGVDA